MTLRVHQAWGHGMYVLMCQVIGRVVRGADSHLIALSWPSVFMPSSSFLHSWSSACGGAEGLCITLSVGMVYGTLLALGSEDSLRIWPVQPGPLVWEEP